MKFKLTLALLALVAIAWLPQSAFAKGMSTQEIEYLAGAPTGVICTTGTVSQLNLVPPPSLTAGQLEQVAGWRIQNQSSTHAVWIGSANISISEAEGLSTLGEKLVAGADGSYNLGRQLHNRKLPFTFMGCKADPAAGAAAVLMSIFWFTY